MTCTTKLSEKDFKAFTVFDIMKRRKMYRSPVTFALILTLCSAVCFIFHAIDGSILLGAVLLVVALGVPAVYFTTFFLSLKKQVRLQNLKEPREVYTVSLSGDEKGISAENGREKATLTWIQVHHIYKSRSAFYLYYTPYKAFILPFRCFDCDAENAWELMKDKLPEEKLTIL